jgi:putative addiction module component (TIGR02574 family)
MAKETLKKLLALPLEERLKLSHRLWESLHSSAINDAPLPASERELLESRLDGYDAHPNSASPTLDATPQIV